MQLADLVLVVTIANLDLQQTHQQLQLVAGKMLEESVLRVTTAQRDQHL